VLFAVFSAGETQIWPGDLRFFLVFFGFSNDLSFCEAKVFHKICTLFYRFSQPELSEQYFYSLFY